MHILKLILLYETGLIRSTKLELVQDLFSEHAQKKSCGNIYNFILFLLP